MSSRLVERGVKRGGDGERGHARVGVAPDPLGDPLARPDERGRVDELERHRRRGVAVPSVEVEVLDPGRGLLEPHPAGQLVVEVLVARAHAADVERRVPGDRPRRPLDVVVDDDGNGRHDVEPGQRVVRGALPGLAPPGPDRLQQVAAVLRAVEDGQPAVGDLPRELEVLRPDRSEVDRHLRPHRVDDELQRLAGAVRDRELPVLALVRNGFPAQRHPHDVDVLAGPAERCGERHAVPALADLRAGHPETEPEPATGERVDRGGGHRGRRRRARGDLHHRCPEVDPLRLRADPREHGRRVRAVGLGDPGHRIPEPVGLDGGGEVLRVVPRAPVSEVDPELHAPKAIGRGATARAVPADSVPVCAAGGWGTPGSPCRASVWGRCCGAASSTRTSAASSW